MNDSDRTARVQINDLKLTGGSTVQLQSANAVPLTIDTVTLLGSGTIDTNNAGMTINTIAAGANALGFTGAAAPTVVNALTAGQVNIASGVNLQSTLTATGVNVTGETQTSVGLSLLLESTLPALMQPSTETLGEPSRSSVVLPRSQVTSQVASPLSRVVWRTSTGFLAKRELSLVCESGCRRLGNHERNSRSRQYSDHQYARRANACRIARSSA